jgi:hypothetical protein
MNVVSWWWVVVALTLSFKKERKVKTSLSQKKVNSLSTFLFQKQRKGQ